MSALNREPTLLDLCRQIQMVDDRLGQYSDYEGDENGPTHHLFANGYKSFSSACDRAIKDHSDAIVAWKRLKKFNEARKGRPKR